MKKNNFIVFSAGCNCAKYIGLNMSMVQKQTYKNYTHILIDDASTDSTYNLMQEFADEKTILHTNKSNLGWLQNSTRYLNIADDDIVVVINGNDWLLHDHVLDIVNNIYNEEDCWMTYGSFIWFKQRQIEGLPYPEKIVEEKKFREYEWLAVYLQTFKGFLFNNIDFNNFKDSKGLFFRTAYDQALMYPMLEMSTPDKIRFIDEPLYVYNDLNLEVIKENYRYEDINYIRNLDKYKELTK